MTDHLLELSRVSKTFESQTVLRDIELKLDAGEVLAIIGQNGCGKSTLIKTLAGYHTPDRDSSILAWGAPITASMVGAPERGLHFIHQDLALVSALTTVENLEVTRPRPGWLASLWPTRRRAEVRHARRVLADFGGHFDVEKPVGELTPTEQSLVAIARAFDGWTSADNILVLDEPTAALHPQELKPLFAAIQKLAHRGAGVILVTHRLNEVAALADRVLVLRDGRIVGEVARNGYEERDLIELMTGGQLKPLLSGDRPEPGEPALEVRNVSGLRVNKADLTVRAGEVVGVTGLVGSGRDELANLIFGATPRAGGTVRVAGRTLPSGNPKASIRARVAMVPADRRRQAAIMAMSMRENLTLPSLGPLRRPTGWLSSALERRETRKWIRALDIRPPDTEKSIELMSGGNQQKVILARWLRTSPKLLLLDDPTQGVDIGAKAEIHSTVRNAAADGTAVLVCSSDVVELIDVCDRVLVFRDGVIVAELGHDEINETRLTTETLGVSEAGSLPAPDPEEKL
ncbi:MAG: ribose transport system ATP-binding protein [Frankiales bacterium]|nr:ribose transport system ATP-binding protein [Frankiales bacterium]